MNSEFTIAVHSLVLLAYKPDHMATSEEIARNVCTHPARVRKVMSSLRKSGYVEAKEGTGGGFMLSSRPEEVTLADLYMETSYGSIKPTWCSGDDSQECMVAGNMAAVMGSVFSEAEAHLIDYLRQITVSGMLERVRAAQADKV